jgi:hypothetical protein
MTSLSQAFEQFDDQVSEPQVSPPPRKNAPKTPQYSADILPEEVPQPPQASPRPVAQHPERFTNYYNYQEQNPQQQYPQYSRTPEYSFWDRMVMSRREVLKLFILSLVIILAISLEKIGCHYLYNYISSTDLTTLQEFLVRLSFPIIVFIILWIIKSF